MGVPKYRIRLSQQERDLLKEIARKHTEKQAVARRAKILLRADEGQPYKQIAEQLDVGAHTVTHWIKRWLDSESETIAERLQDLPRPGAPDTITPEQWCRIIAMSCEKPSKYGLPITDWTHRELANEIIRQKIVDTLSPSHLGRMLKKKTSSRTEFVTG